MKRLTATLLLAGLAAACGETTSQDDCTAAVEHVQACMPGEQIAMPDSCDADMAATVLSQDCETVRASAADGKADCNPWFWWTCTGSSSSSDDNDVVVDAEPNPVSEGLVCGADARDGDFERYSGGDVDAVVYADGWVFAAFEDWGGTLGEEDDEAFICAYELDSRAWLSEEHCFLVDQPETPFERRNTVDAMAFEDGLLYVAVERALWVYDVSDVEEPMFVGSYLNGRPDQGSQVGLSGRGMEVHDGFVYLAGGGYILDARDLDDIRVVAEFEGFIDGWTVVDGVIYAARGDDGIATFDVSDPSNPVLLDSYMWSRPGTDPNFGEADFRDIAVGNGFLYAAVGIDGVRDDESGLWIFDVSDPSNLRIVHQSEGAPREGFQVAYADGYLFHARRVVDGFSESHHEIGVYDVSDASSPKLVENIDDPRGVVKDIAIAGGNVVYITEKFGSSSWSAADGIGTIRSACE